MTEELVLEKIGKRFKKLRIDKKFTSYEHFAVEYELSRMQYWKIEKGKTNITIKTMCKLLEIHNITIEEFFCIDIDKF